MNRLISLNLTVVALVAMGGLAHGTQANPTVTSLLKKARGLTSVDVDRVLVAARAAMAGKSFHVRGLPMTGGPKWQILMDPQGRPRYLRSDYGDDTVAFDDYTGRPAVSFSGKPLDAELVVEYARLTSGGDWTSVARVRTDHEPIPAYFEMLRLTPESGPLETIDGRVARALVASWRLSGDNRAVIPAEVKQVLWLDVETLLPVRWEMARAGKSTEYGLAFSYDPALRLIAPAGAPSHECVRVDGD